MLPTAALTSNPPSTDEMTAGVSQKKSRTKFYLLLGVGLFAILAIAAIVARRGGAKPVFVTTEKATVRTLTQLVSATGKVQPEVEVKISPEAAGEIVAMPFREGAVVKKGELLVKIKPDNYQAAVEQQEASLAGARATALLNKAQLVKAEQDFKQAKDLYERKLISDSDFTAAQTNLDVAQGNYDKSVADIRRAEGSLNQAKDTLSKTIIYAPIDGIVTSRTTEVGERVAGVGNYNAVEVMRVADLNSMEVRVNINENDIVNVQVGDKARIAIDAYPGRKFTGVVKEIGASAKITGQATQDEITNFQVKIRILEKDAAFRPGMSANADVETKTVENAVVVPIQSVTVRSHVGAKTAEQLASDREKQVKDGQGPGAATAVNAKQQQQREREDRESFDRVVFVKTGDVVKMKKVETGISDTSNIEVKSGIAAGEEVVSGSFSVITRVLKDGMKVQIEKPKKDAPKS